MEHAARIGVSKRRTHILSERLSLRGNFPDLGVNHLGPRG